MKVKIRPGDRVEFTLRGGITLTGILKAKTWSSYVTMTSIIPRRDVVHVRKIG